MSKATKNKEKQQCAVEKPKLDNGQKLRNIHVIDPEDQEHDDSFFWQQIDSRLLWKRLCPAWWRPESVLRSLRETVASGDTGSHTRKPSVEPHNCKEAFGICFSEKIMSITSLRRGPLLLLITIL